MDNESTIIAFANRTKDNLLSEYIRLGLRASGEYGEELEQKVDFHDKGVKITILGAKQGYWMENGRKPNKNQTHEAVKKWVGWAGSTFLDKWTKDKGLQANPFAIAWKIARKGIPVPNKYNAGGVISNVINDQWVDEGIKVAGGALLSETISDILKQYKRK